MIYPRTNELAHWINEREAIRIRKEVEKLPAPWSTDHAMSTVRYCNVHREDDKVTRYLRASPVYSGSDVPTWVVVLSRMLNRISTLELVQGAVAKGHLGEVTALLKEARSQGTTIWGNAYTISTCGKSMDKIDYVVDWVVTAVRCKELEGFTQTFWSCREVFNWLTEIDGLGSFLAGQVVADLKNTPGHPLSGAPDVDSFAVPGPGSLRGLSVLNGYPVTPGTFAQHLALATQQVLPLLAPYVGHIHAQDMQNCFCEFSKYVRFKEGGHVRNRYDPSN